MRVTARSGAESVHVAGIPVTTPPLPQGFPSVELVAVDRPRMEPGVTLTSGGVGGRTLFALDSQGRVVWYYRSNSRVYEVHRTPEGLLRMAVEGTEPYGLRRGRVLEIDMRGDLVRGWAVAEANTPSLTTIGPELPTVHHDVQPAPDGGLFVLSIERLDVPDYPTSEVDPLAPRAPAALAADVIAELNADGSVRQTWHVQDYIDPHRIGYDSVVSTWWGAFFGVPSLDWAHANSVFHDVTRDELVVSLRQQDTILCLDRPTGDLKWMLAPPGNWSADADRTRLQPTDPDFRWLWHQHSAEVLPSGNLLVFDNANNRANAYERRWPLFLNASRVVELAVDREAKTVELVWSYARTWNPRIYVPQMGDADLLPETGNVLVTFGTIVHARFPNNTRLVEVTHTTPAEVVWEVIINETGGAFRSRRLPSLYP